MCIYLQVLQGGQEDHGDPLDPVKTDEVEMQHGNIDPHERKQHVCVVLTNYL